MGELFMETADKIPGESSRNLPLDYTFASGNYTPLDAAIGNKAPGAANGPPNNASAAMGEAPYENMVNVWVDTAATLTLYVWHTKRKRWVFGGANTSEYQKSYDANGEGHFNLKHGRKFLLVASTPVAAASVSGRAATAV